MFSTRQSKLPFYKSHIRHSLFKKRQKWIWRCLVIAILCIFFFRHWNSSNPTSSSSSKKLYKYKSPAHNTLEVQLRPPASSDARDFKELTIARETKLVPTGSSIPKIVHFVYGLRGPNPTLDLIHYIAIKSAYDVIKPTYIMFHYHYMPTGDNFERAKHMLTLNYVPLVETVFGRPVTHYAHRADVVRLQVLEEYGGIYLDLDLISLKPVDHLLDREFIMAQEGIGKFFFFF
jgi:mannosyltransferase OCH1-like enzyme